MISATNWDPHVMTQTITENLELTAQERCLLRKGLSRIPTRAHDDEYTEKQTAKSFPAVSV